MSIEVFTATISSGQSLSGAVDLGEKVLAGFQMPSTWTSAAVTFLGSADGVTFDPVAANGGQHQFSADASTFWTISPVDRFHGLRYLKVQSGNSAAPVNQGGDRDIHLVARSLGCSVQVSC
jgi:hypothetical protein